MSVTIESKSKHAEAITPGGAAKSNNSAIEGGSPCDATGVEAFCPASSEPDAAVSIAVRRKLLPPKLDERLRTAADWVQNCEICADIGCDHGHFGAVLLSENRCKRLLSADVSAKALAKAKARLSQSDYGDRTVFAVADGLNALSVLPEWRADVVCILGMGGDTVAGILRRGRERLHGATLILGAQTDLPLTRTAIAEIGYRLTDERIVCAEGRLYLLMRAIPAANDAPPYTEWELLLGPCLLKTMPAEWKPWLVRKHRLLTASVSAMRIATTAKNADRMAATLAELNATEEALCELKRRYPGENS